MEPTEGSETSAFNIQTPGKYPEEYIPKVYILTQKESLHILTSSYLLIVIALPDHAQGHTHTVGRTSLDE
jgi:hypothetical protein